MRSDTIGYFDGYLGKEASWAAAGKALAAGGGATLRAGGQVAGGAAELAGDVVETVVPYLIALPVAAGLGAGLLHSRVTSPSPMDKKTMQEALRVAEYEEYEAELSRRRAEAKKKEAAKAAPQGKGERALHV